jgi:hypothetical protein
VAEEVVAEEQNVPLMVVVAVEEEHLNVLWWMMVEEVGVERLNLVLVVAAVAVVELPCYCLALEEVVEAVVEYFHLCLTSVVGVGEVGEEQRSVFVLQKTLVVS